MKCPVLSFSSDELEISYSKLLVLGNQIMFYAQESEWDSQLLDFMSLFSFLVCKFMFSSGLNRQNQSLLEVY